MIIDRLSGSEREGSGSARARFAFVLAMATVAALSVVGVRRLEPAGAVTRSSQPNIVFILTDDLDTSLINYVKDGKRAMPNVHDRLVAQGMSFAKYFVTDSLCCPSRASTLRGQFPHNTKIFTNDWPDGGFDAFHLRGEENATYATALLQAGYRTALMGKYLNHYAQDQTSAPDTYVPPGWTRWDAVGWGYDEYDYDMNRNGTIVHYGSAPSDYLTDVISAMGQDFISQSVSLGKPFFLEMSTFTPHAPYVPAPRHVDDFPDARAPRPPSFNEINLSDKPEWLRYDTRLNDKQVAKLDAAYRLRVQDVESIDDMVGALLDELDALGQLDNTYIVFSSDNGYHLGSHRMLAGKVTAYDSDIHVPLIVRGPGVAPGTHTQKMVENIDLAETFARIAGVAPPAFHDGRSLLDILHGVATPSWRSAVLVEHHGPDYSFDTRLDARVAGGFVGRDNPSSYEALRLPHKVWVEYADGEREYYDYNTDPYELVNGYRSMRPGLRRTLHEQLVAMKTCAAMTCWSADR